MSFVEQGFADMGVVYASHDCHKLMKQIEYCQPFRGPPGFDLFLTESEYRSRPQHVGVNPRPGRNLLHRLDCGFIFENAVFCDAMTRTLGVGWRVMDYELVMGVPHAWLPDWLIGETRGLPVANLGAYVRPIFRDMTYFHGIDWHQDIIDFKDREADFVTAYVYLEDVDADSSPLHIIPGSHKFGATVFPHFVTIDGDKVTYMANPGQSGVFTKKVLTGPAGSLYFWHACTLHGTQPHRTSQPRISVRLLVEKGRRCPIDCELDRANALIEGPLMLSSTRRDLSETGAAVIRGNVIAPEVVS